MSDSVQLEEEVRQIVRTHLWIDTRVWALHEGIGSADWLCGEERLKRLDEIGEVIGLHRVREIWAVVRDEIRAEMADMVRELVPPDVIEDWLAGRMSVRPAVAPEDMTYEWPGPTGAPPEPAVVAQVEFDPEESVRDALEQVLLTQLLGYPPDYVPDFKR